MLERFQQAYASPLGIILLILFGLLGALCIAFVYLWSGQKSQAQRLERQRFYDQLKSEK